MILGQRYKKMYDQVLQDGSTCEHQQCDVKQSSTVWIHLFMQQDIFFKKTNNFQSAADIGIFFIIIFV